VSDELRTALERLPRATCYRTHLDSDDHRGVFGAVWLADVGRVLTTALRLDEDDVDLAALLHDNGFTWDDANVVNAILTHHGLVVKRPPLAVNRARSEPFKPPAEPSADPDRA
jgi:hypothetical protein